MRPRPFVRGSNPRDKLQHQRLHQRRIDPLADAGAFALQERHHDAERKIDARSAV